MVLLFLLRQQVMVQSNHFSSELARIPSDHQDVALPCVPGLQGTFDLTAEARYLQNICIIYFTNKETLPTFCSML